jgi:hypothetical protein
MKPPEFQLEFVEAAMLKGDDGDAEQWLEIIADHHDLSAPLRTVRDFYAFWLSSNKHNSKTASESFSSWKSAVMDLRQSKNTDVGWSFKGAKAVWKADSRPSATLFLDMITALEDSHAELPSLPSGS